jgi:hypothetical protein
MDNDKSCNWGIDQGLYPSPRMQPCVEHTFLFVNESATRAGFKSGRRHEVRSHIRKEMMNNYKKQMTMRQEDKERHRYRVLAPLEVILQKPGMLEPDNTLHLAASYTHLKEADIQELGDKWKGISTDGSTSGQVRPIHNMISTFVNSSIRTKTASLPAIRSRRLPQVHYLQGEAPYNSSQTANNAAEERTKFASSQQTWGEVSGSSLIQSLAAGRVDPFLSYPGEAPNPSTHELMDHSKTFPSTQIMTLFSYEKSDSHSYSYYLSLTWTCSRW